MNKIEIENKLREIIAQKVELDMVIAEIGIDQNLFLLGIDSFDCVKVVVEIEKEFNIEFEEGEILESFESINSLTNYIIFKEQTI